MADANVVTETTRERTTKRTYLNEKGEESSRVLPDLVAANILFVESDYLISIDFRQFAGFDKVPEGVLRQMIGFGAVTRVTNSVGSSKLTTDEKIEAAETIVEAFLAGNWGPEREGGPRTNDLVEAVARVQEKRGKPLSDEAKKAVAQKLSEEVLTSKELLSNPAIRAAFDAIKLERQQARAAKSAARATDVDTTSLDSLLG